MQFMYETTFSWAPDASVFPGSEASALGMTTELISVPDGQPEEEGEVEARFELLIVQRGDGFAFSWEVMDGDTSEIIARGEASTLEDAKNAAEASARHDAERLAGRCVSDEANKMLDDIIRRVAADMRKRHGR